MTEQERNVLLNELRQQESQREKQIKRERFRRLNPYAKKGAVVFAGSSLMEQFPLYEFLQDDDLHCTLYNRGIGGFTTTELLEAMDECILELQPAHLFLNIGTNDLNGPDYDRAAMLGRYEEIVQQIRKKLPETKLYLLAYYPVNPTVAEDPGHPGGKRGRAGIGPEIRGGIPRPEQAPVRCCRKSESGVHH